MFSKIKTDYKLELSTPETTKLLRSTKKDVDEDKLMDNATETGIDAAKSASKRVVQKTAEATVDLIGNKIADKINSIGKPKEKEITNKVEENYIPPKKRQQIIDDLRFF